MNPSPITVTYHALDTGCCLASEHHVIQGGQRRQIECHSLVALIEHPQQGWLLWDAGYAPRMLEATRHLPFSLYRRVTPLRLRPELAIAAQLPRFGLAPADIRRVLISHFHADHIAGLRDFSSGGVYRQPRKTPPLGMWIEAALLHLAYWYNI